MAKKKDAPLEWLPIDTRLFAPFLSFKHVHGVARVFLITEMLLSVVVVMGTVTMALLTVHF